MADRTTAAPDAAARAAYERLAAEHAVLTAPGGAVRSPGGAALNWFRTAWPDLARVPSLLPGDEDHVRFALLAVPFLIAVENWAALVAVCRPGADAAARLAADDDRRYLLLCLGVGLQHRDDPAAAAEVLEQLRADAAARGDHRTEGAALAHLGQVQREIGRPDAAARLLQRAVLAYRQADHPIGEARAAGDLMGLLVELGDEEEAARYAERARRLFRKAGDRVGEARALRHLAAYQAGRGRPAEALLRQLREAVALHDASGDSGGAVEALQTIARVHLQSGDHEAALQVTHDALARVRAADDSAAGDLGDLSEGVTALAAADALTAGGSDTARAAVAAERPEALGPFVLLVLQRRRRELDDGDEAARARIDAAVTFLRDHPGSWVAEQAGARWNEFRTLAGTASSRLSPQLPELLRRLAATDDPDERSSLLATALDAVPADEPEPAAVRGVLLLDLAKALHDGHGGAPGRDRAITCAEEAARLLDRPVTRRRWAECQVFLGTAWRTREAGDPRDLDRAIGAFRQALTVYRRASDPVEWAATVVNLANVYWRRRDGAADLRHAVARHTAALSVFTREEFPGMWATVQSNLGLVLTDPVLAGDPGNLEAGRRHLLDAVATPALDPPSRAAALLNLARCERDRILGDPQENIDSAVRHALESYAIQERIGGPRDLAEAANAVGDVVGNAALRAGRDPAAAAEWFERALHLAPVHEAPLLHAAVADNLANTLVQLDDAGPDELQRAVALHGTALRLYRAAGDRLEEARACYNLAATLRRVDPPDDARAVALLERSRELRARERVPLEWAESVTELARAWLTRADGPDPQRAADLLGEVVDAVGEDPDSGHALRAWGLLGGARSDLGHWSEAAEAYERALAVADHRYRATVLPGGRDAELVGAADLAREAAYATAAAGDAHRAVTILEGARARGLGDRLERDRADLSVLAADEPVAAAAYREAGERILRIESQLRAAVVPDAAATRRLRAALTDARAQMEAAVDRIRALPGFATFLLEAPDAVATAEGRPGLPLVYLCVARHGAVALVVAGPGAVEAVFGPLTDEQLMDVVHPYLLDVDSGLEPLLDVIGDGLVGALAARLALDGAIGVVLVPTGVLGAVPVHAARYGAPPRHLLDDLDVAYAPSARVLRAARAARAAAADRPPRLVGVAEPLPRDPPLPWAVPELTAVAGLYPGTVHQVPGAAATTEALLAALPGATHLHFAGHGRYDAEEPLDSELTLAHGDRLTLRRLLDGTELDGVHLVVASACRTATTDMVRLPDEAVGLPAGLVQAGAAAVIGTLWEVNDRAAALLVSRCYAAHLRGDPERGEPPAPPARALAKAQRWLARASADDIRRFTEEVGLRRPRRAGAARRTQGATAAPTVRALAHPRHWAAFVLVGEGTTT